MTQHGNPYPDPGQYGGQQYGGQPQPGQQPQYGPSQSGQPQSGQPQYGQQPAYGGEQYGGQPYGGEQYGQPQQAPASGYAVPAGTPGYGHVGHPPAGGFAGQQQAGYASQMPTAPNGQPLADVWTRLLARLLDGLIVGGITMIVAVPLFVVVFAVGINSVEVNADGTTSGGGLTVVTLLLAELGIFLFTLIVYYVYEVEFAKRTGQTVGKRVLKLRVVPLDPNQPLDRGVLTKRWLVMSPGSLIPGFSLLNPLWCLWDQPYRQCLHDKFAKTVVVKVPA